MTVLVGNIVCITAVDLAFLLRSYVKYSTKQPFTIEDCRFGLIYTPADCFCILFFFLLGLGSLFHPPTCLRTPLLPVTTTP